MEAKTEIITCPCCNDDNSSLWAKENGYKAVKCINCGFIYVNPRPVASLISDAVKTGVHTDAEHGRTVIAKRINAKVSNYKKIISKMFSDVMTSKKAITWLDVGAGYGEFVEAVSLIAPMNSNIEGLEPMKPKADCAKKRGLKIREIYLNEVDDKFEFVSLINVFSHIPDFRKFLDEIKKVLVENGELLIETGNTGDLVGVDDVPGELNLPDHLVFAGEKNIVSFLNEAGFSVVCIYRKRTDGLIIFLKNCIKKILGRRVNIKIPYTSSYRTLLIRAKLTTDSDTCS